jgi:hypothetical protein
MSIDSGDPLERMTPAEVIGLARELIGEMARLRAAYEKVSGSLAKLQVEHQAVKDELARLKNLPPRPPQKPSGMDKATGRPDGEAGAPKGGRSTRRRGSNLDKLTVTQTIDVRVDAPAGSRHKGYEEIVVQDLVLNPLVTRYRRERWETPDGKTLIAPLDPGIIGGYGPHLHRVVLMLHYQCHVTIEKILALLNGMGVVISKRQVGRLLTVKLETFRAEDDEVLKAGLSSAAFVTVDDTGARHQGKSGVTTQIGSDNFTVFRTGLSKSRLAFLRNLLGGAGSYVVNEAALVYMRACNRASPSSTRSPAIRRGCLRLTNTGRAISTRSGLPISGSPPIRFASPARALCGALSASKACSARPSSCPTAPASSASANTPCAGCTPNASPTSSSPQTTSSATRSRSPGA